MISTGSIEQLKARVDIIEVVGSYIELKKHGATYKAVCPFHAEKTPSLVVSPTKGIFHCFGCKKGGDSISFVKEIEHLSYPEAIEKLARIYNFTLHYTDEKKGGKKNSKILESFNEIYKKELLSQKEVLEYISKRGIAKSSVEKFEIGYAPTTQKSLAFLKDGFFNSEDAYESGLFGNDNGKIYPRFIERVTFPIYLPSGKLVGFGGRTLGNHPAKYLNSPETELFKKSKLLYGYQIAKDAIYKKKSLIVTEGYLDVIMLHQAGFDTAVATLGTALTREHLPLIKKGEPRVILAYDGDSAGIEAAFRASKILSGEKISGGVVLFEGGLDPADMVYSGKIEELNRLFLKPKSFVAFVLEKIVSSFDIRTPEEKNRALESAREYLKTLPPLIQEEYKGYLASLLKVSDKLIKTYKKSAQDAPAGWSGGNIKEKRIIKTILEKPHIADYILEFLDEKCFVDLGFTFLQAIKGEEQDEGILEILLDEKIAPYEEADLREELRFMVIMQYAKDVEFICRADTLDFKKKQFLINTIHQKISQLKSGKLIGYEAIN